MLPEPFNRAWTVRPLSSIFFGAGDARPTPVTLPHDQQITLPRDPDAASGRDNGFFPAASARYEKSFHAPEEWKSQRIILEFEGVYRDARVYVNGALAAHRPYGYSRFFVSVDPFLSYGAENVIRVECSAGEDSRWYSGLGIYRPVTLHRGPLVHIAVEGPRFSTPEVATDLAVVQVETVVKNESPLTETVIVDLEITDTAGRVLATDSVPATLLPGATAKVRRRVYVTDPQLWSPETPHLHHGRVSLLHNGISIDHSADHFGIRRIRVDPVHGLRINGKPITVRGACVHHDNGPLGAATIGRAEERRVELLRAAGFNALRSAHNPMSKSMLAACDRLGMLVMDEAFDSWTIRKTRFDYSRDFPQWWRADIESMVVKDFNHPSVAFYSIGNEIFESGNPLSAGWGRDLAAAVYELDPARFTVNSINALVSAVDKLAALADSSSAGVNDVLGSMNDIVAAMWTSDYAADLTAEAFGQADVAGYNYGEARYDLDLEQFPHRVCISTETARSGIAERWSAITRHSHVLGEFCWSGFDYLGEVGIGRIRTADNPDDVGFSSTLAHYPYLTSATGDLDITGIRRASSYYRETVFGFRSQPYIAVVPARYHGITLEPNMFGWDGSTNSWTWPGDEGAPVRVDIYSDADEVELMVNGRIVGHAPAGPEHNYRASFQVAYEPGVVAAVAYRKGTETSRTELHSAGPVTQLSAEAEVGAIGTTDDDLAYVRISLRDSDGRVNPAETRRISVTVEGPAVLAGLGSGDPKPDEPLTGSVRSTFEGTVLAVIRPTGTGTVTVHAAADGLEARAVAITVV